MKLAYPLFALLAILAVASAKHTDAADDDVELSDWISTKGIDDDVVDELNDDIRDCVRGTHTHDKFYHCIDDHMDYYDSDELTSKQKSAIRKGALNSRVHRRHHHGRQGHDRAALRGL
jgi:hypothetical protein